MNIDEMRASHPLERDRQTGRTTRMFEAAKAAAMAGEKVVVVLASNIMAASAKYHYPWHPTMIARPYRSLPQLDWKDPSTVVIDGVKYKAFIDHDVFHKAFSAIFKGFHAYDESVVATTA